jgi:hypothetical protein
LRHAGKEFLEEDPSRVELHHDVTGERLGKRTDAVKTLQVMNDAARQLRVAIETTDWDSRLPLVDRFSRPTWPFGVCRRRILRQVPQCIQQDFLARQNVVEND